MKPKRKTRSIIHSFTCRICEFKQTHIVQPGQVSVDCDNCGVAEVVNSDPSSHNH